MARRATHPMTGEEEPSTVADEAPPALVRWLPRYGRGRWPFLALDLLLVLLIGSCVFAEARLDRIDATARYPLKPTWGLGEDWLLVTHDSRGGGDERRPWHGADGRRITVMLFHLRHAGGTPMLVSVPLNSSTPVPGYGQGTFGAAFARGGPQLLVRTFERATRISIEHYVDLDFGGLAAMVDAVGGVRICTGVPARAGVPETTADCPDLRGRQALAYLRGPRRTGGSGRTGPGPAERQRRLVAALVAKVTSPDAILHPLRTIALFRSALGAVTVDQSGHLYDLVRLALAFRDAGVTVKTVPTTKGGSVPGVGPVVVWDHSARAELIDAVAVDRAEPGDLIPDH